MKSWFFAAVALLLCGPAMANGNFTVKLDVTGMQAGDYVLFSTNDRDDLGYRITDPSQPIEVTVEYETVEQVYIEYTLPGMDDERIAGRMLYVDRPGEYVVSGSVDRNFPIAPLLNTTVTGGIYDLGTFNELIEFSDTYTSLYARASVTEEEEDELAWELLVEEIKEMRKSSNEVAVRAIRANPDAELSAFLLDRTYYHLGTELTEELLSLLSPAVMRSPMGQELWRDVQDYLADEDED